MRYVQRVSLSFLINTIQVGYPPGSHVPGHVSLSNHQAMIIVLHTMYLHSSEHVLGRRGSGRWYQWEGPDVE